MRNWKIIMMVLCLALCLPGLFGMAEAKGGKDMVKEKTAYVTRCSYSSSGSSTGGHEHIELTRLSDTEASYKISSKDWHSSPERVVEKKVSANVFKTVSLSVSYKDPTNGAGWTLTMRSDDELNDKQREYYHKLLDLLYGAEGR